MATTAKIEIELNALLVDEINRLREAVKAACADFECVSWGMMVIAEAARSWKNYRKQSKQNAKAES